MLLSCVGEPHTLGITSQSSRVLPAGVLGFYQLKCGVLPPGVLGFLCTSQSVGVISRSAGVYQPECSGLPVGILGFLPAKLPRFVRHCGTTWPVSHVLGQIHTSQATG